MRRVKVAILALSIVGITSLSQYEGFSKTAYLDIVGVPTIGYGSTKGVKMGDRIDEKGARSRLLEEVKDEYGEAIKRCVKVPLHQYEYDAYISFTYNVGAGAFCGSTLVKRLNEEKYDEACGQLHRWNRAKGKVYQGLVNRREKEYKMCMGVA